MIKSGSVLLLLALVGAAHAQDKTVESIFAHAITITDAFRDRCKAAAQGNEEADTACWNAQVTAMTHLANAKPGTDEAVALLKCTEASATWEAVDWASAEKCVQANAKPQESPAERSAKIVAAIMDRCPKETDCFENQMAAFGRMMNLPSGSTQEDAFYRCTSAAAKFEDIDWEKAAKCVEERAHHAAAGSRKKRKRK
jgi:hypothetical protein